MTVTIFFDTTAFDDPSDLVDNAAFQTFAGSVQQNFEDILNGVQEIDGFKFTSASGLNVTNGVADAPLQFVHVLQCTVGVSETIHTITPRDNAPVFLVGRGDQTFVLEHGTGNIYTADGNNITLADNTQGVLCYCIGGKWLVLGGGGGAGTQNNFSATVDPTATDDDGDGYGVGSLYLNALLGHAFINVDDSTGAAIWKQLTDFRNTWAVKAADTGIVGIGIATPTLTTNTAANVNDSSNTFCEIQTTASSGNIAGWPTASFNLTPLINGLTAEVLVKMDSTITTERVFVGFASADLTNVDDPAAGTKFVGFRFSTVAADGGWMPIIDDGSTLTPGSAIGTVTGGATYKLRIQLDTANQGAYFSVNDGPAQFLSASGVFPSALGGFVVRLITTSAANRRMDFSEAVIGWG